MSNVRPHGRHLVRAYRLVSHVALAAVLCVFVLVLLASLGVASSLSVGGVSLWPFAIVGGFVSFLVWGWAGAKAKGWPGWYGAVFTALWDPRGPALLHDRSNLPSQINSKVAERADHEA